MLSRLKTLKNNQRGNTLIELLIVVLIISILCVIALPQLVSSRRLVRFSAMRNDLSVVLRETRQYAVAQQTSITFHYNNSTKEISIYGGKFGKLGDDDNLISNLAGIGLPRSEIYYGRPPDVSIAPLADTTDLTNLQNDVLEIKFRGDGSVVDASGNPINNALFFYNEKNPYRSAFAVSVFGAGGRIKTWLYDEDKNAYLE